MARLEPGQEFGPYRVVEQAGKGGMATVYKAYQASLSRFVALKLLPDDLAQEPEFLERFELEAKAVANLRHPNIPAVHDFGTLDGVSYFVTDYVDGGTLSDQVGKPLPLSYTSDILRPIASALDYAHSRGVLHRDIKPSNILLARDGTPFLNDFGLARILVPNEKLTSQNALMGTPAYMAPEQGQGLELTPAADIYALATVAYEMLTGHVPFEAETPAAVIIALISSPLPPPRQINPALSEEVEQVLLKGLAKAPEDRYQTAGQFVAALAGAASAPIAAAPISATPAPATPAPVTPAPVTPAPVTPAPVLVTNPPVAAAPAPALVTNRPSRAPLLAAGAVLLVLVLAAAGWIGWNSLESSRHASNGPLVQHSAAPATPHSAVPKGALVWRANLGPGATDLQRWDQVQDATQQLSADGLQYSVAKSDGYFGNSIKQDAPPSTFIAEMTFEMLSGSATITWTLADPDQKAGERMLFVDPDGMQVTLGYMPLNRPQSQDPDILAKVPAPWLKDYGKPHTLDVKVTPTEYTLWIDGVQKADFAASPTPAEAFMEIAAFGNPGAVLIKDIATYQAS